MGRINVTNQRELGAALKKMGALDWIECIGDGEFEISDSAQVRAYGSAQVRAYGSAQVRASDSAQVTAYGSAQVTAYDSAQVTAYDSAQVTAYDSAQVRAYGSAQVRAYGSAQVTASRYVAVTRHSGYRTPTVTGGVLIDIPRPRALDEWFELYGVEVTDGMVTLYKAVDDDWATERSRPVGIFYAPGSSPEAPDWDGGKEECGGGLHFTAHPHQALDFNPVAKRFVACPIAVADIAFHPDAQHPTKVKASRVAGPIVEVTIDGQPVKAVSA